MYVYLLIFIFHEHRKSTQNVQWRSVEGFFAVAYAVDHPEFLLPSSSIRGTRMVLHSLFYFVRRFIRRDVGFRGIVALSLSLVF